MKIMDYVAAVRATGFSKEQLMGFQIGVQVNIEFTCTLFPI
jgi:hypothetical protein